MTARHRVRVLLGVVVALTALTLVGCASIETTRQQAYMFEMGRLCEAGGTNATRIDRVSPDGRTYWVTGGSEIVLQERPKFFACMKEQVKAHPFLDWAKAQKRAGSQPLVAVGSLASGTPVPSGPVMAPVWQVGDEWQYAYKSPTDSGTYVWSVNRIEMLDGVQHYVIKTGTREIFYRVSDLASSLERVDGVIVSRETPSRLNFSFPLTVGKSWEQTHRQERPVDRQTTDYNSLWTIEAEETVTVIAGTFRTLKITRRNKNTGALILEMWVAPDVKQFVKIREILSNGQRERELTSFKLK